LILASYNLLRVENIDGFTSVAEFLKKYDDRVWLHEGLSISEIESFSETIGATLPRDFIDLYRLINGGNCFGLDIRSMCFEPQYILQMDKRDVFERDGKHYLDFAHYSFGDMVCVELNNENGVVIQISHETGEIECTWKGILEFFAEFFEETKGLIDEGCFKPKPIKIRLKKA